MKPHKRLSLGRTPLPPSGVITRLLDITCIPAGGMVALCWVPTCLDTLQYESHTRSVSCLSHLADIQTNITPSLIVIPYYRKPKATMLSKEKEHDTQSNRTQRKQLMIPAHSARQETTYALNVTSITISKARRRLAGEGPLLQEGLVLPPADACMLLCHYG
jgi:hypothetical protein